MPDHTIADLAARSGFPVRTIRYYIAEGLIPAAGREGSATRYPEATLARLRLIRRLQGAHQPLAEIRRRLTALTDGEVARLLGGPDRSPSEASSALDYVRAVLGEAGGIPTNAVAPMRPSADAGAWRQMVAHAAAEPGPEDPDILRRSAAPTAPPPAPTFGERASWERIVLGTDIELHVRRPLSRRDNRIVDRMIAFARQLQEE